MQIKGGKLNRTNSTSPPPHYTAHTRSPFWLWQKNNNNTIVFVGFTNGRSWRTSLSPSHQPCPSVNAFERVCVLHYIPLPTNLHLFPEDKCFVKAQCCLHQCHPPPTPLTIWGLQSIIDFFQFKFFFFPSVALCINMFVLAISLVFQSHYADAVLERGNNVTAVLPRGAMHRSVVWSQTS